MASYGGYEADREIGSAYGSAVYSARKTGETSDTCAVKVYAVEALVGDSQEAHSDLNPLLRDLDRSFLRRIELQKKAAESSSHVAPILDSGRDERGIWYVTRLYPRSLQRIIAGHVALTRENLYYLFSSLVRGAVEFKKALGRPHGNLKSSNVLISGAAKMLEADVVLSDPLPGEASEAGRYEHADLRALGEILLQLVRRRELTETSDWLILPIETSAEWTELFGKQSPAWLALCNRLLDPKEAAEDYSLDQLDRDLGALAPKPPVSLKTLLLVTGAACLVAGAVAFFVISGNTGKILLTSEPPGATIYVQGKGKLGPAPQELTLAKGDYAFEAQFGELSNQFFQVSVQGRATHTNHLFKFDYGAIVINSDPPGALIQVGDEASRTNLLQADGKTPARTPYTLPFLTPGGRFKYELTLDNRHETAMLQATVPGGGQSTNLSAKLPVIPEGEVLVSFSCNLPRGEKISLSGSTLKDFAFESPFSPKKSMPIGRHTVTAKYRDWPAKETTFVVEANREAKAEFAFEFGRVILERSDPPGARYSINGKPAGVIGSEPVLVPLPPGAVTFTFDADGFETTRFTTNIVNLARLTVVPRLTPMLGFFVLTSDPAPAQVSGAGANLVQTVPNQPVVIALQPGNYTLNAAYKGLKPLSRPVVSVRGRTNLVDFSFAHGNVRLAGNVPGAEVRDPLSNAWMPLETTLILPEGATSLTARDPVHGLADETIQFDVNQKQMARSFDFKYGTVIITSVPPIGVEVRIAGTRLGSTPLTNSFVKPGQTLYELALNNKARRRTGSVLPNTITTLGADFTREEVRGYTNSLGMELLMVKDGYYLGRWEVSEDEYKRVMGGEDTRSAPGAPNQPVTLVGWSNVLSFCAKLTELDKAALSAQGISGWQYAIPTEKEWREMAVPSLATLANSVFSPMALANVKDGSRTATNEFGFFDMFGNVAEWCLGTDQKKITLGGSVQRVRPNAASRDPYLRASEEQLGADTVLKGNKVTGIRCLLRAPAGP